MSPGAKIINLVRVHSHHAASDCIFLGLGLGEDAYDMTEGLSEVWCSLHAVHMLDLICVLVLLCLGVRRFC